MLLEFICKDIKQSFHGYTYTRIKFKEALSGKGYFKTDVVKKFRNYTNWKQIIETAVKGSWVSVPDESIKGEMINADFKPAIVELRNPAIEQKPKQLGLLKNGG